MTPKSRFGALACTTALIFSVLSAPQAFAADNEVCRIESGTAHWNIKDSYLGYIAGPIARGTVTATDGATYDKAAGLNYTVGASDDVNNVPLGGKIHFEGHHGVLDMELTNMHLVVNGTKGEIKVDYKSRPMNMHNIEIKQDFVTKSDVAIAEVDLAAAPASRGEVSLESTKVVLTQGGSDLFGPMYEAGLEISPLTATYNIKCEGAPAPQPPAEKPADKGDAGSSKGSGGGIFGILLGLGALGVVLAALVNWANAQVLLPRL